MRHQIQMELILTAVAVGVALVKTVGVLVVMLLTQAYHILTQTTDTSTGVYND